MPIYREHQPTPHLRPHVRCLWELVADPEDSGAVALERVVPDGCMEWVFHLGTPFCLASDTGALERQAQALVVGVTTRAIVLEPTSDAWVLGVRFEPGHGGVASPWPAHELADCIVPAADDDSWFAEVTERLHATPEALRVARLQEALLDRFRSCERPSRKRRALGGAIRALVDGTATVDQVARASGLSARQLQRRFLDEVGVGPKHLARITRFARAAELVSWTDQPLTAVAYTGGYADQSHFAREFRALAGLTPRQYRAETHGLADALAGGAGMSHSF